MEIKRIIREWWQGPPHDPALPALDEDDEEMIATRKRNELVLRKLSLASAGTVRVAEAAIKSVRNEK